MARQLQAAGQAVSLLAMLDSYAPKVGSGNILAPKALGNIVANLPHWINDFVRLGPEKIRARLRRKLAAARKAYSPTDVAKIIESDLSEMPETHRRFIELHYQAILAYQPQPYKGKVTLFRAQAQALSRVAEPDKGWGRLAQGGVEIREFAGSHHTLLREPYVRNLAEQLQLKLMEIA
jgi:thioesterase domain-containing protein